MADARRCEGIVAAELGNPAARDSMNADAADLDAEAFRLERHANDVEAEHLRTFRALNELLEWAHAKRDAERDGAA